MIHVVIVAAGSGTRFGGDLPKQFQILNGRPMVMTTIEAFRRALPGCRLRLVISEAMAADWAAMCRAHSDFPSPPTVFGGATRFDSVKAAVDDIARQGIAPGDLILVHDGARPLVTPAVIARVVEGAARSGAAVPVVAVTDSLREVGPDGDSRPVDRARFRAVQTPQGFDAARLIAAYDRRDGASFTDDASVAEAAGMTVTLVDGDYRNIKITNRGDLDIAAQLLGLSPEDF